MGNDTHNLDEALADTGCKAVDYIKLDIEGAELEVLSASDCIMNNALAIKTEVAFLPFRKNQPLATDIDIFLRQAGFELMEIVQPSYWRRHGNIIHPFLATDNPPYSKAQIVHCDFLYFRDPDSLQDDVQKLLKLALIALSFGYFDHALAILERPGVTAYLKAEFGGTPMEIVSPASRAYGRKAFLRAFFLQGRHLLLFVRNLKNFFR